MYTALQLLFKTIFFLTNNKQTSGGRPSCGVGGRGDARRRDNAPGGGRQGRRGEQFCRRGDNPALIARLGAVFRHPVHVVARGAVALVQVSVAVLFNVHAL